MRLLYKTNHPAHKTEACTRLNYRSGSFATATDTHILLQLGKGLADSVLWEDHGLPVREAFGGPEQRLSHRVEGKGGSGRAVGIAGGQSRDDGRRIYVNVPGRRRWKRLSGQITKNRTE